MAGRKSPWGSGDGSNAGDGEDPAAPAADGTPDAGEPAADVPKGPRNPWKPAASDETRRSASIEDIFRAAKRGGGGEGGGGNGGRGRNGMAQNCQGMGQRRSGKAMTQRSTPPDAAPASPTGDGTDD